MIVSHAASFALDGRDDVLRVRITASSETRQRQLEQTGVDPDEAARRVRDADKNMKAYLKHFYGVTHELPTDYDLVLNSDRVTVAQAVSAITAMILARTRNHGRTRGAGRLRPLCKAQLGA